MKHFPILLVLAAVALTYHAVPQGEPVYDDTRLIVGNAAVTGPWSWGAILAQPLWGPDRPYWRPLTQLALAVGWRLGGITGVHVLSLLLHLAAVAVVFRIVGRCTRTPWVAAVAALWFGVHPAQVESVAWASAISDPLWGLCALLSLDSFLEARTADSGPGQPRSTLVWLALGLLAKETAVVIPLLLVVADQTAGLRGAPRRLRARDLAAMGVVLALWLFARMLAFSSLGAGFDRGASEFELAPGRQRTLGVEILGRQALNLLWPWTPDIFRPMQVTLGPWTADFLVPALATAALVLAGVIAWRRRAGVLVLALAAFLLPLLPGVVLPRGLNLYPIADRQLYLGVFGLTLALVTLLVRTRAAGVAALVLAAALAWRSHGAVTVWANPVRFFGIHAERHPEDARLQYSQAGSYLERYQTARNSADLAAAETGFARALALGKQPAYGGELLRARLTTDILVGQAWCSFAREVMAERPDWEQVAGRFTRILERDAALAEAHIGLGYCLANLGRLGDAERHLVRALVLDPKRADARENLRLLRQR